MLPRITPMTLLRQKQPFDHPDWLFELKHDGFRTVAYFEKGSCKLVSRNDNTFQRFGKLSKALGECLDGREAVLDGEIVCLDANGRSMFYDLLGGRGQQYFYAFDLLYLDGEDLRELELVERKSRLTRLIPEDPSRLLYVDHVEEKGVELFEKVCELDLEGIVAKPKRSSYNTTSKSRWIKINSIT